MGEVQCPHCAQEIDVYVDPGGGELQEYIEDCSVCCRPILFHAELVDGEYVIQASAET